MKAGALLRRARRKAGLSQRALAEQSGVPQSTVGRIEAGLVDPRVATLDKILEACGFELEVETRLGEGVDRSQIQEFLALSPRLRLEAASTAARNVGRLRLKAKKVK